jgi:hypothetical protein
MKETIIFKKTLALLLIGIFSIVSGCSSDQSGDISEKATIIGKWHNYKRVENNVTYTDTGANPISNLNYEFQNNSCIITEDVYKTNYIYKIDGDYIKFYNPQTEVLTGSERIVTLTIGELVVVNQYNSNELKYFKKL